MDLTNKPYVIVNADDFNLTAGVSRAIITLIQKGIVSSTSVFVTKPATTYTRQLQSLAHIGVGLHFNIT